MSKKIIHTAGKRKTAIARATLSEGTGVVRVNSILLDNFQPKILQLKMKEPLILAGDLASNVDIKVNIKGGGQASQIDAARLAIGRALAKHNKKLEKVFLSYDRNMLVADVRRKEPCKPNDSKARAKRQKSYR